ncbi:hypothetical protein VPH35_123180 [Triticum aestivum]
MCYSYSTVRRARREKQVIRGAREVREVTKAAAALGCRRRVRRRMERGSYTTAGRELCSPKPEWARSDKTDRSGSQLFFSFGCDVST